MAYMVSRFSLPACTEVTGSALREGSPGSRKLRLLWMLLPKATRLDPLQPFSPLSDI